MLGQIAYPSKSTGDVVDNLMGNTEAAKALPLSAYQGYVLDGKIAAINNNISNIQVASLTVTTQEASAAGQPVTIANSVYTITANFDSALSVTVPIYTWGEYTVACGGMSEDIAINPDLVEYEVELASFVPVYLYNKGDECTGLTGGWKKAYKSSGGAFIKNPNSLYVRGASEGSNGECGCSVSKMVNFTGYKKLYVNVTASTDSSYHSSNSYPDGVIYGYYNLYANYVGINDYEHLCTVNNPGLMCADIAQLEGEYCICIFGYAGGGSVTISQIWVE